MKMATIMNMPILTFDDNDLDISMGDLKFGVITIQRWICGSQSCMSTHFIHKILITSYH